MRAKTLSEASALREAFERVLAAKSYVLGEECAAFEAELAADVKLPSGNIVSCNSGTDALILGLKVMGVGPGDEVVVPAHTAVPTVAAVRSIGAVPRFADIDPETWVMDASDALALVGPQTKAVVPVHLYGNSVALNCFSEIQHLVLEDVAQAQGGSYEGKALGSWGRVGAYSFYPTKNLGALGDGGAVAFKVPEEAEVGRKLRFYGQKNRNFAELDGGINSRLDEIQAALLRVRMKSFRAELSRKEEIRARYLEAFRGCQIAVQKVTSGCHPAWHLFVIALESRERREAVQARLEGEGVGCLVHYPVPNHQQKAFAAFRDRALPATESLCQRILSLPFHANLANSDVDKVADLVMKALRL